MASRPRLHSNWIHDFVAKTSPKSEAPERYLYWSAVSAIGGAMRRRCYIKMGHFKWYPNFYIILVGPPGLVKKSTTVDMALSILRQVPGVNFGSDCTTWEQFVQEIAEAKDIFAVGGEPGKPANIYDQEYEATCALTLSISEFGTFFDPKNHSLINVMTEVWDGKDTAWKKSTKTQGSDTIVAPFVNLIAGTTPDWMNANFKAQFGGWGLSSRCILLHADKVEQTVAYPDELWGDEIDTWWKPFLADLETISLMEGPFSLSPRARALGRAWYEEHMDRIAAFSSHAHSDPWTGYYLARKQSHIHKLALVLAAAQREDYIIHQEDLAAAIQRCNQVEDEITNIFGKTRRISNEALLNHDVAQGIVKGILSVGGRCPEDNIFAFTYRFMAHGKARELLTQMVAAGFLAKVQDKATLWYETTPLGVELLPEKERPH